MNKGRIFLCVVFLGVAGVLLVWSAPERGRRARAGPVVEAKPDELVQRVVKVDELRALLVGLKSKRFKEKVSVEEVEALKRTAMMFCDSSDTWEAILQLWLVGERDFVELMWWRKDDWETRAFIVALDWCSMGRPPGKNLSEWPGGIMYYDNIARRFTEEERVMRIQEADLVRDHYEELRGDFYEIMKANGLGMAEFYKPVGKGL